jgi:phospholipid N-methyltransferase
VPNRGSQDCSDSNAGKCILVTDRQGALASRAKAVLRERARFLRSFLDGPRRVGAVLPTSLRTVRATLDMAPVAQARCVVELGAGTGPYTREIVRRLRPDARLLAFELDPALAERLAAEVTDPRVRVIADSAANLDAHLDGRRPEVIVSGLPFTSLPGPVRREILHAARRALADDGVMLVLQYSPFMQRELERLFGSVRRRLSLLNVPPAVLFACRTPEGLR